MEKTGNLGSEKFLPARKHREPRSGPMREGTPSKIAGGGASAARENGSDLRDWCGRSGVDLHGDRRQTG